MSMWAGSCGAGTLARESLKSTASMFTHHRLGLALSFLLGHTRTGVSAPHSHGYFQSISLSTTIASYTKGGCRHLCHIQQTELRAFPTQSSRPDTGTLPLRTSEENRAICRRCHARTRTPAVPAIARSGRLAFPSPQDLAINQGNFSTGRQQPTENLWPSLAGRIIRSRHQIG